MDGIGRFAVFGGITTVAACAFAYVLLGPTYNRKKRKKDSVPGLINFGNWCFANAVLQSLSTSNALITWLSKLTSNCSQRSTNVNNLAQALLNTLNALNNDAGQLAKPVCSPADVLNALKYKGWVISTDEQDAHELFHVLTSTLEEEFHTHSFIRSLLDVRGLDYITECSEVNRTVAFRTQSPIKIPKFKPIGGSPTKGLLASRLTCKSCGFENPVHYESFDSISLSIPDGYFGLLRLEECLNHWSSSELVHGVTCSSCSKLLSPDGEAVICKSTFSKQLSVAKLPECLCFHFVRTLWLGSSGFPTKKYDHVVFPEFLSMDRFLLSNKKKGDGEHFLSAATTGLLGGNFVKTSSKICDLFLNDNSVRMPRSPQNNSVTAIETPQNNAGLSFGNHTFQLKSVIVHVGDAFKGHFVTYRKGPINSLYSNTWFYTSDTIVHQATLLEVLKSNAYMLLYERINTLSL